MTLKEKIHAHYLQLVNEKLQMLQQVLSDLKESGASETKSTAGDKHETALAMIQIEQSNKRAQLKEAIGQKEMLEKINPSVSAIQVANGSLVKTNRGYFFISVALGRAEVDDVTVVAISPQSPLGNKLMKLIVKDVAEINGSQYTIETIE